MHAKTILLTVSATMIAGYTYARLFSEDAGAPQPGLANTEILASFDRDLNRQPTPRGPVQRESIEADPLYAEVNAKLRGAQPANDQILASFDRAFNREEPTPSRVPRSLVWEPIYVLVNDAERLERDTPDPMVASVDR